MRSFQHDVLDRLALTHEVVTAVREIGEGKGKQDLFLARAPEILDNLRQAAIIESTESSNRLEGITLPKKAFERIVIGNEDPQAGNRSEGEIAGYRNVLNLIHERHEFMELTPNLVLQLHRDLFRFVPGAEGGGWKRVDNVITERRSDGTTFVRFTPTPALQTERAVIELHERFKAAANGNADRLILVALFILDFLCIHPFADGNGRIVRLLTVLLLYREDYLVARYVSLERLIEQTRLSYYETLYASSQGWHEARHDPMPWVSYFLSVVRAAYAEFGDRVGELRQMKGMKTLLVLEAIDQSIGDFSISELHRLCPTVGWDMVRHVLRSEREAGRLQVIGRGRAARWRKLRERGNGG